METRFIAALISRVRDKIHHFIITELKTRGIKGISSSHGDILYALLPHDSLPMKDIARIIERNKSTVTVLIAKLEKTELVEKTPGKRDKRIIHVRLTQKGKALTPHIREISQKLIERINTDLSELERDILVRLLVKVDNNF